MIDMYDSIVKKIKMIKYCVYYSVMKRIKMLQN